VAICQKRRADVTVLSSVRDVAPSRSGTVARREGRALPGRLAGGPDSLLKKGTVPFPTISFHSARSTLRKGLSLFQKAASRLIEDFNRCLQIGTAASYLTFFGSFVFGKPGVRLSDCRSRRSRAAWRQAVTGRSRRCVPLRGHPEAHRSWSQMLPTGQLV